MNEEAKIFKAYQRGLLRQLVTLETALKTEDYEEAEKLLNRLIEDTKEDMKG